MKKPFLFAGVAVLALSLGGVGLNARAHTSASRTHSILYTV